MRILPAAYWTVDTGRTQLAASALAPFAERLRRDTLNAMAHVMDCASGATEERMTKVHRQAAASLLDGAINFPFPEICEAWGVEPLPSAFRLPVRQQVPVLLISGPWDAFTPPGNAREVMDGLPNAAHLLIEGVGHSAELFLGSPAIGEAIGCFLTAHELKSDTVHVQPPEFFLSVDEKK